MQLSNLLGNNVNGKAVTSDNFLHVDILKNRVLELEKQLSEKNTIIKFLLSSWLLTLTIYQKIYAVTTLSTEIALIKIKIMIPYIKKGIKDLSNKVVVIGDFKSKEVDVLNFPGATSSDVLTKIDDVLNKNMDPGTNDLTIDINLLSNLK